MTGQEGAAALVMMVVVALLAVVTLGTASLGLAYSARVQAANAADAAALAAAVATYPGAGRDPPIKSAREVAAMNGALLVGCDCAVDGSVQTRTVVVRTVVHVDLPLFGNLAIEGVARAEFDPHLWLGR